MGFPYSMAQPDGGCSSKAKWWTCSGLCKQQKDYNPLSPLFSIPAEIHGVQITCPPSHQTVMLATCPLCREPVAPLGSAARATCLSSLKGHKEIAKSGRLTSNLRERWTFFMLFSQVDKSPTAAMFYSRICSHVQTFSTLKLFVPGWAIRGKCTT